MSDSNGKHRKMFVDHPNDRSKHTCLIHSPGHSPDECKVLGDVGSKYSKSKPSKDCGHYPATKNKFNRKQ